MHYCKQPVWTGIIFFVLCCAPVNRNMLTHNTQVGPTGPAWALSFSASCTTCKLPFPVKIIINMWRLRAYTDINLWRKCESHNTHKHTMLIITLMNISQNILSVTQSVSPSLLWNNWVLFCFIPLTFPGCASVSWSFTSISLNLRFVYLCCLTVNTAIDFFNFVLLDRVIIIMVLKPTKGFPFLSMFHSCAGPCAPGSTQGGNLDQD